MNKALGRTLKDIESGNDEKKLPWESKGKPSIELDTENAIPEVMRILLSLPNRQIKNVFRSVIAIRQTEGYEEDIDLNEMGVTRLPLHQFLCKIVQGVHII